MQKRPSFLGRRVSGDVLPSNFRERAPGSFLELLFMEPPIGNKFEAMMAFGLY